MGGYTQVQPTRVELNQFSTHLRQLKEEEFVDTFIGAMMSTQGIVLLFFSHRLNRDFSIIVSSTETSKVIQEIGDIL